MSLKKYQTMAEESASYYRVGRERIENEPCPTAIPHNSSLGQCPLITTLNAIKTHGKNGARKVSSPSILSLVSGLRRLQM